SLSAPRQLPPFPTRRSSDLPWDMANVVAKITGAGNPNVLATERGVSFGYNTLISDMRSLPIMARTTGAPVIFDATHSVQQPGGRSEEHTSELQSHFNLVCRL